MATKPHFKFYPKDYLGDTQHLDIESHGLYMLALMHLWINDGYLTKDKFRAILKISSKIFEKKWKKIDDFFKKKDNFFYQDRVIKNLENYYKICEINRINANHSSESYSESHSESHSETQAASLSLKVIKPKSQKEKIKDIKGLYFKPPTILEISEYAKEINSSESPDRFFDYYESKGWIVGKVKMKSWKASFRNWTKNSFQKQNESQYIDIGREINESRLRLKTL